MPRLTRIAAALCGGLGLLTISACTTVSGPSLGGYSSEPSTTSAYPSTGVPGAASVPGPDVSGAAALGPGDTIPAGSWEDRSQSTALTDYLDKNRLPMVGAQVFVNSSGTRWVILRGFVGTEFGKQDAATKARSYLGDPAVPVANRIIVRPELLASGGSGALPTPSEPPPSAPYSDTEVGSAQSYESQAQQAAQAQQAESTARTLMLLLQLISLFF